MFDDRFEFGTPTVVIHKLTNPNVGVVFLHPWHARKQGMIEKKKTAFRLII